MGCDVGDNRGPIPQFTCMMNIFPMIHLCAKNAVMLRKRKGLQTCISGSLPRSKVRSPNKVVHSSGFDPADVGAIKLRLFRECFLRKADCLPSAANVLTRIE